MTTLIIPDLHHHVDSAEEWIAAYPADQVVLLGDYFDNFGDTPGDAARTAGWLRVSLDDPRRIHLWGNHDLPYAFPGREDLFCPGFTEEKAGVIGEVLHWDEHWSRLELVHFEGEFAFSHAGLSRAVFGEAPNREEIENRCREAMRALREGHAPLDAIFTNDGLLWQRWQVMDHLAEFHQIVGHTPMREVGIEKWHGRLNVCLDTYGRFLGWLEDDRFSLIDTETGDRHSLA